MKVELETVRGWNDARITLIEEPSGMGDEVVICIHKEHDEASIGTTVRVYKSDLIRAAKMLGVPYASENSDGGDA